MYFTSKDKKRYQTVVRYIKSKKDKQCIQGYKKTKRKYNSPQNTRQKTIVCVTRTSQRKGGYRR